MTKYLILLMFMIPAYAIPCCCDAKDPVKSLTDLEVYLRKHSTVRSIPAKQLAKSIRLASTKYKVNERKLASVILVESRGEPNLTSHTGDYGIAQINPIHGLSQKCLKDWHCNLEFGAFLLARTGRPCEYNVGKRWQNKVKACLKYESKLGDL